MLSNPYLRLIRFDKPVGTLLLLFPCLFALFLANPFYPSLKNIFLFALGAFLMRSAGCVINDVWDRKLDRLVARTMDRPIAAGEVSVWQALLFAALLMFAALFVLLQFNSLTILIGLASVVLVVFYPLMKRITGLPQLFLGLTFNIGVPMAWAAETGGVTWHALLLYIGCICWTVGYDTIYAFQDIEDDLRVGIKSTAISFGKKARDIINVCYLVFIITVMIVGMYAELGLIYFLSINVVGILLLSRIRFLNFESTEDCLFFFKANTIYAFLILSSILVGKVILIHF